MNKSVEVWLVRHGETEWSLTGQHSGRHDLPLTARGEEEARTLGALLGGHAFDRVLCSPLQRARRTCELAGYIAVAEIDPELHEWDYGDCTSFTLEQLQGKYPGWNIWAGPVPNGESLQQIADRASRVACRIQRMEGRVAVFAHGHFLRVFTAAWLGLPPSAGRHFALDTSAVCVLGHDAGFPAIRVWNRKRA